MIPPYRPPFSTKLRRTVLRRSVWSPLMGDLGSFVTESGQVTVHGSTSRDLGSIGTGLGSFGTRDLRGRSHMTSSLRGRGGFQMMTIDDGGGRGGLANDDVTKNCQIFGRFLGISSDL